MSVLNIIDLAMDFDANDILITNGDMSGVTGQTAIQQDIQQALQLWLGEWFLDTTQGVPFKQYILVKNPNLDLVQSFLLTAIQNRPGVVQIVDFQFNYDSVNRAVSVQTSVQITNGQTITAQASISPPTLATIQGTA